MKAGSNLPQECAARARANQAGPSQVQPGMGFPSAHVLAARGLSRRLFLRGLTALGPIWLAGTIALRGEGRRSVLRFDPSTNIIAAPDDAAQWPDFRDALTRWRTQIRQRLQYSDALYRRPEFAWSSANYCCCFLMVCDETFCDAARGCYSVTAFLNQAEKEFGGYDSVVLWHAYPRIGVDERNQFDFYRDLPGGLRGLRRAVRQFHRRGVRVYIDYNPWDTGTRREPMTDLEALAEMVRTLEADGIFLDTLNRGAAAFRTRLDSARAGVILEGEDAVPLENIFDHHASWAQWFEDSAVPGVLRHKWIERRHMQHQIKRWDLDHSGELHAAWMNGSGMMVWENVFGSWVPWNARDRSILRAMLPIQRRFTPWFTSEDWTPLVATEQAGVFASQWEHAHSRLWTFVNRRNEAAVGRLMRIEVQPGDHYFDLVAGQEVQPKSEGGQLVLYGSIPARGVGCFLAANQAVGGAGFRAFLARQARLNQRLDLTVTPPRRETRLRARPALAACPLPPPGMVEIPAATLELEMEMRVRECGFYESMPAAGTGGYDFTVRRFHRQVSFPRFAMDETPVTNAAFGRFLRESGYRPRHKLNFLKHWERGRVPSGRGDHPVVYIDLEDARAYARWAAKRLPTEEEWQYAAQGADGRLFPWGSQWEAGRGNAGQSGGTTPVKAFPAGRSPFGCYDMCGNVWQWTESERSDGRTRFCIIRGGAWFAAKGSNWYVDGGPRPVNFATKFLLTWSGLDRCSTIGFRCVCDLT